MISHGSKIMNLLRGQLMNDNFHAKLFPDLVAIYIVCYEIEASADFY